ncbi:hypothetical protein [Vibrio harveyi]|uniref:hypothetical protein n=1 Tax=Vibrio harveyi TaxID=669 RepID=UPI00165DBFB4|nr:hypothetical protein [Vibrio harveyi]
MAIEATNNIGGLNPANPSPSDRIGEAYKHIQVIKKALKGSFPSLDGAVTLSESELNNIYSQVASLEVKIKTATDKLKTLKDTTPDKDKAKELAKKVAQETLKNGFVLLLKDQALIPPGYSRLDATGKKFINPPGGAQTTDQAQVFALVAKG